MRHLLIIFASALLSTPLCSQSLSAIEVLQKTIAYHDPNNEWPKLNQIFKFSERSPDGIDRITTAHINNQTGYFLLNRGDTEIAGMILDSCFIEKGSYDCARAERMRNYYLYLWGLPMKLTDVGTPLDENVLDEVYDGISCYVLRVSYEKDTWYFYIDKKQFQMIAYKFYQDELESQGELIKLEEIQLVQNMKIPRKRSWYTLPENKYLGTDILNGFSNPK